nr:smad nuclear-interacting protein 1 [Loxodonta africana]
MKEVKSERERGSRRRHRDGDMVAAATVVVKQERLSPETVPPAHRRPDSGHSQSSPAGEPSRPSHRGNRARGGSRSPAKKKSKSSGRRSKSPRVESREECVPRGTQKDREAPVKEKPSFELSGALLEDTNTFRGVVIKYSEPPEARIPKKRWRLYPFKNDEVLPVMYIHRQSAYLLGRHRRIADIPIDHPSCSKQHAVFQYRLVEYTRADGTVGRRVKPYIIDLGSGNGTFLNNKRIEPQRYYELKEKDVLKFGFSSREYVLLHESSDTSEVDRKEDEDDEEEEEVSDS